MVDVVSRGGRPRSERAREAVLHAVDDLLVEVGYAAMTMKGIAERAGVGRQTVYRWWATKAEILHEASRYDALTELTVEPTGDAAADLTGYLERLLHFLTGSDAGAAYRALVGEAQHDTAVATLLAGSDVLASTARAVIEATEQGGEDLDRDAATLVGPVFFWVLSGQPAERLDVAALAREWLSVRPRAARPSPRATPRSRRSG